MSDQRLPGSTSQPNSGRSTPQAHQLPARPPPPAGQTPRNAFTSFKPRAVAAPSNNLSAAPAPAAYNYPPTSYGMNTPSYQGYQSAPGIQSQYPAAGSAPGYGQSTYGQTNQYAQAPPQIQNPFAPPSQASQGFGGYGGELDPEYQAQMQQWQSQYMPDANRSAAKIGGAAQAGNANKVPLANNRLEGATTVLAASTAVNPETKQKTVVRSGGGQTWEDNTLLEWGNHHRLFIGNLAGEVTDESLLKAFSKYPSVQKARVVRDKRTTKSQGYGFVSLADADEYFQAAKEMQGKYIGSHPVLIRRAETEIKAVTKKDNRGKNNKYKGKGANGGGNKEKDVLGAKDNGVKKGKVESKYKVLG